MTGTPGARPPPAAPSVFQDRLDGGAEASRGASSNQVGPHWVVCAALTTSGARPCMSREMPRGIASSSLHAGDT